LIEHEQKLAVLLVAVGVDYLVIDLEKICELGGADIFLLNGVGYVGTEELEIWVGAHSPIPHFDGNVDNDFLLVGIDLTRIPHGDKVSGDLGRTFIVNLSYTV
tara:strand:+ start:2575 stop:2883 length:309 start_codon:yes stop_codon:yes gene_type:complete